MKLRVPSWPRSVLLLAIFVLGHLALTAPAAASVETCLTGPEIEERFCHYVVHYNKERKTTSDPRVLQALGTDDAAKVRSIALIIAVSKYPQLGEELKAASVDATNLVTFFEKDQSFDEVILLRDEEATKERIEDFLQVYLPSRARRYPEFARLVIAYSGHGSEEIKGQAGRAPAAFLLSEASGGSDVAHTYLMKDLAARVRDLAQSFHQILTLVNACYGGSVYGGLSRGGGNPNDFSKGGSYAITAGSAFAPVVSLDDKRGSLFFDVVLSGVRSGDADRGFDAIVAIDGTFLQYGGLTRTGPLLTYVTDKIGLVNYQQIKFEGKTLKLDPPWFGPLMPDDRMPEGGPFFVSPKKGSISGQVASADGPSSFLPGRPDIKLFRAPEIYPIRGIDISVHNGAIDWPKFLANEKPQFVYVRSNSWSGVDAKFAESRAALRKAGVDYGAEVVFDFCLADKQFDAVVQTVPVDKDALPIAVSLVTPVDDKGRVSAGNKRQAGCYPGAEAAKTAVLQFAGKLRAHYGKQPIFYGNAYNLNVLTDPRFNDYMIWLAAYGKTPQVGRQVPVRRDTPSSVSVLQLKGANPWTLWQYTSQRAVPGIGESTAEVFFGTANDYAVFKAGAVNAARQAALRAPIASARVAD